MEAGLATHAAARLRSRSPALLSAELRQRHLPSRHQRIRRVRAGHDPRHRPPRPEPGRALGPADLHHRRAGFEPACSRPPAKFRSSPTTSRRAPDSPTPSATSARSWSAPDTASSIVRIPQIYNSVIQTENGITDAQVFLNNTNYYDHQVFPSYPNPLVSCPLNSATCSLARWIHAGRHQRCVGLRPQLRDSARAASQPHAGKRSRRPHHCLHLAAHRSRRTPDSRPRRESCRSPPR